MASKRSSEKLTVTGATAAVPARRSSATSTRTRTKVPAAQETNIPTPVAAQSVAVEAPAFEAVAALAYSYWEARGYQGGSPEQDWLRAESEIRGGK